MPLQVYCRSCMAAVPIHSQAKTRPDLAHEIGEEFRKTCPRCAMNRSYHVNEVFSTNSKWFGMLGITAAVLILIAIVGYTMRLGMGLICGLSIGGAALLAVLISLRSQNKAFNAYRLPR